jgi:hypothetical protein
VRETLEAVAAGDRDQRDAGRVAGSWTAREIREDISPEDLIRALVGMCYMLQSHPFARLLKIANMFNRLSGRTGFPQGELTFGSRLVPVCRVIFFISKLVSGLRTSAVMFCPAMVLLGMRPRG